MPGEKILKALPGFIPRPKRIILGKGDCEWSRDVRLTTSAVLPLQRKTMRSVFNAAGIKVVANKKKYIIEALVDPSLKIEAAVPKAVRHEYYEIEFSGPNVYLRTAGQDGIVWGSFALAGIYQSLKDGQVLPNMVIRDWPSVPLRGLYVRSSWPLGLMDVGDWTAMADMASSIHFNRMFIELYDTPRDELFMEEGVPLLLASFADEERLQLLKTEFSRDWYSPRFMQRKQKRQSPFPVEKNNLQDMLLVVKERGMAVVPTFSLFAGNQGIPAIAPKLAARDAKGAAKASGLCYANELTGKFLDRFFGYIFAKHFGGHPEWACIRLDDGLALPDQSSSLCECPKCRKSHVANLVAVIALLKGKGVDKVVLTDDPAARKAGLLSKELAKALEKAKLKESVLLLSGAAGADAFGLERLSMVEANARGSVLYRDNLDKLCKEVASSLKSAKDNATVAVNYHPLVYPQLLSSGAMLWDAGTVFKPQKFVADWGQFHHAGLQEIVEESLVGLDQAAKDLPPAVLRTRPLPELLKELQKSPKAKDALRKAGNQAETVLKSLFRIQDPQAVPGSLRPVYGACRSQAALLAAYAHLLADMLEKKPKAKVHQALLERMEVAERQVPEWMNFLGLQWLSAALAALGKM